MFCGTRSFSDINDGGGSRASSLRPPKLSKLKQSLSLDRGKKQISNPYSKEGLDKFEQLVAELEAKKEEVLLKKKKKASSSDQDSTTTTTTIVRFKYNSDTGDWIPIIVRLQPEAEKAESSKEKPIRAPTEEKEVIVKEEGAAGEKEVEKGATCRHFWAATMMVVAAVLVVVALVSCCFVLIGRAFVVCSATILWYVLPMMKNSEGSGIGWDWKLYGKSLMITTDKWLASRKLGVAPPPPPPPPPSSMNVKKKGSGRVIFVSKPRRSAVK